MSRKKIFSLFSSFVLFGSGYYYFYTPRVVPLKREVAQQTLFVALDAIPFSMIWRLHESGRFPSHYQKPSKLISVFPSTTTASFTGIFSPLGAAKAPGYDAKFFSFEKNKVMGNLLEAYDLGGKGYMHFFKYKRSSGLEQVVMYTAPFFALHRDLKKLKPIVWQTPNAENIFFYIGSSDSTAHLDGIEATENLILTVTQEVENLKKEYQKIFHQDLKVVFFSDHGFHWDQMKALDVGELGEQFKKAGLKLSDSLGKPGDVAAITWGNISGGDLYMAPNDIPKVAEVLLQMQGIDLIFFRKKNKIIVQSPRNGKIETAEVAFDSKGEHFCYQPKIGDPLFYSSVGLDCGSEKDWFEKTKDHHYPDALYRIWAAFFQLSENPATLLLSTLEDYEFGDNLTRWGAKIRGGLLGTHGAMAQDSSAAFVMTDRSETLLPEVIRYDQMLNQFIK